MNLNNSTGKIGFSFQNAVAANSATLSFTQTPFYASQSYLVISNLMYGYSLDAGYQFTTSASLGFSVPGDKNQYSLAFSNHQANVYVATGYNQPISTSLVVVTHSPANSLTGAVETWTITPDNTNMNPAGSPTATQVGDLVLPSAHGGGTVTGGEFSMPFQFVVTRK